MLTATIGLVALSAVAAPVQGGETEPAELVVEPTELTLRMGETAKLEATVRDADGNVLDRRVLFLPMYGQLWQVEERTWGFNLFQVLADGTVTATRPGSFRIMVRVPRDPNGRPADDDEFLQQVVPLTVLAPPISRIDVIGAPRRYYQGTRAQLALRFVDALGNVRDDVTPQVESSDPSVARVDSKGTVQLLTTGSTTITVSADDATASVPIEVAPHPAVRLRLDASQPEARTGDVVRFSATLEGADGAPITDVPVLFSVSARVDPLIPGGPSTGLIDDEGRFVADVPGEYSIVATTGDHVAVETITVVTRDARQTIELVGHGRASDHATSDLWVWEGPDGRDYAITGTLNGGGAAHIWDVTDPGNLQIIDMVRVDARSVNDVKVSADGRIAVISREGASTRRNGVVILDVSEPQVGVRILSTYDDELTGGVHNVYLYDRHLYALSAGRHYDIISLEDPEHPRRVGRFALDNPNRSIHDVVVHDGIAYSANWNDGVVLVDVGGGGLDGTPRHPVEMGSFAFPTGWNHAVYPYRSQSTGKFYIFAGDEAARSGRFSPTVERGLGTPGYNGEPNHWRGWIHIVSWNDGESPEIVARYEVPEAGSHNIWVEDDLMYVAFYNGGLRVVDVSGELMGDLYRQGREIARFLPFDPEGFTPNAPQVWGAQPHKGVIFFSDINSGLWAVRLRNEESIDEAVVHGASRQ